VEIIKYNLGVKTEMGQEGSDTRTIPTYKSSFEDDYTTSYECEIAKNNNDNYFPLYSAPEYKAKMQEVGVGTEPKTEIEKIREMWEIDRKMYED